MKPSGQRALSRSIDWSALIILFSDGLVHREELSTFETREGILSKKEGDKGDDISFQFILEVV